MPSLKTLQRSHLSAATTGSPRLVLARNGDGVRAAGSASCAFGYALPADTPDGARQGVWAEWSWDGERLTLRNDRFGFYPLFFSAAHDRFAVSPSIVSLLAGGISPELDDAAMAVFARLGFFVGGDTPFRHIRAVPPNCDLAWRDGDLNVTTKPIRKKHRPSAMSRQEALHAYGDLFQAAVERMLPQAGQKVAVPLSGGRDSRHIVLALVRAGCPPHACVTSTHYPPAPNEDAAVAAQVTRALGVPHEIIHQPKSRVRAEIRKNVLTHFCADEHGWALPLADHLRTHGYTQFYTGIGGDVLSAGLFLHEKGHRLYERRDLTQLAEHLLGSEGYLPDLLPAEWYRRWSRELAVQRLVEELGNHVDAVSPITQFYFWNRTRREIALSPWHVIAGRTDVLAPYLDHELYDFLTALPVSYLLDHRFHTDTIAAYYPEHAALPYESKDVPERMEWAYFARFGAELLRLSVPNHRGDSWVRRRFLIPRVMRGLVDRSYAPSIPAFGILAVYLTQLGTVLHELDAL